MIDFSADHEGWKSLSKREREIFILLIQDFKNKKICQTLFISHTTVSTYQKRILSKLGLQNPADLKQFAKKIGIDSLLKSD